MKMMAAILMAFALLASPVATAAVTVSGPDEARTLSATGSETITYTAVVDCEEFVGQSSPTLDVTLAVTGLPDWFGASAETVSASGQDCLTGLAGGTSLSIPVKLTLSPTSDAWGHLASTYSVKATAGSTESAAFAHKEPVQVEYIDGHTMTPSISFPYNFTEADGPKLQFNVDLEITANGNTMIMFIAPKAAGTVSGLSHQTFFLDDGSEEPNRTLEVEWTPPAGNWVSDTISFYTYSHCLRGSPCDETNEQNVTWTIFNDGASSSSGGSDSGKESPGATPVLIGLAVLGAAFIVRRK